MTPTRHCRAPRTPCAHTGCPFLTRDEFCPLHRPSGIASRGGKATA